MSTLTINNNQTTSFSMRGALTKHPFVAYFVLAFVGTWLCLAPMVLGQDGLGLLPYSVPFWLYATLFLASSFAGPTVAALVVTHALEGKAGVMRFLRRYGQWRVGWLWVLLPLLGFPALFLLAATLWMGFAPVQALLTQWSTFFTVYLPAVLIFPGAIQWGEEPGWRGFAQTRMQGRYGALGTALIVGFLHGVWHLPNHLLVVGPPAAGPFDLMNFAINTAIIMALTLLLTWLFNGAQQSILMAVIAHAAFNASQAWSGALLPTQDAKVGMSALVLIVVAAVVVAVVTKGRLGYASSPEVGGQ